MRRPIHYFFALGLGCGLAGWALLRLGALDDAASRAEPGLRMRALVTAPGENGHARFSPDGRRMAFLSEHDQGRGIGVLELGSGALRTLSLRADRVEGVAWSPDGARLAALVRRDEEMFLGLLEAGGARRPEVWRLRLGSARLVRWLGRTVYLESEGALWRLETISGALRLAARPAAALERAHGFELSADGRRLLFLASLEGRMDLWSSAPDGSRPVRLTDDPGTEAAARWGDAAGQSVILSSDQGGPLNLWRLGMADGRMRRLTLGGTEERVEDVSADGKRIALQRVETGADLHALDPESGRETRLTAGGSPELWPSAASGGWLAFQRGRREPGGDPEILLGRWRGGVPAPDAHALEDGVAARLSPDGRWLAYLQAPAGGSGVVLRLWALELGMGRRRLLTPLYDAGPAETYPLEMASAHLQWSRDSQSLYFAARTLLGTREIQRFSPARDSVDTVVAGLRRGDAIGDLMPSADGRKLGYVLQRPGVAAGTEVHALDLGTPPAPALHQAPATQPPATLTHPGPPRDGAGSAWPREAAQDEKLLAAPFAGRGPELRLRGALLGGGWLILRRGEGARMQVLELGSGGRLHVLGELEGALGSTARFDPRSGSLYLTRAEPGAVHNLYAFAVATGAWRRLTDNRFPGTTFCGIDVGPSGGLLYSRQKRNTSLWLIEAAD